MAHELATRKGCFRAIGLAAVTDTRTIIQVLPIGALQAVCRTCAAHQAALTAVGAHATPAAQHKLAVLALLAVNTRAAKCSRADRKRVPEAVAVFVTLALVQVLRRPARCFAQLARHHSAAAGNAAEEAGRIPAVTRALCR